MITKTIFIGKSITLRVKLPKNSPEGCWFLQKSKKNYHLFSISWTIKNHQISKLIENRTRYDSYSTKPFFVRAQDVCGRLDIDLERIQKIAYS
jgi:hypothetical protein